MSHSTNSSNNHTLKPTKQIRRTWGRKARTRYENIQQEQQLDNAYNPTQVSSLSPPSSSSLGLEPVLENHNEKPVNSESDYDLNQNSDDVAIVIPPLPDDDETSKPQLPPIT